MMNFFKRRQDNRRKKPRPEGRVANFWQGFVSLVFCCILDDGAGGDDVREVVNEPSASTTSAHASSAQPFTLDSLADHRKTNHEPRLKEGKKDGKNTPSEKKNWFSWFKKGSKKNKVTEEPETNNNNGSVTTSTRPVKASLSESSFKILQLTASPGGARKAYSSGLCSQSVRKADTTQICPSFGNTMIDVDLEKKILGIGNHNDTMETFSTSDVSSFGASEMLDSSQSSSFTEVTSLSSGEISDCWGLSDGQLPPSISSSNTHSFTDVREELIQVPHTTPAVEGTMSASSDGSHGLESKEIPSTCSSGIAVTSGDIDNSHSTHIEVSGDAPSAAVDTEASSSSDSAVIPVDINTSDNIKVPNDAPSAAVDTEASSFSDSAASTPADIDTPNTSAIEVPSDTPSSVETLNAPDRFGEVAAGGTINDVYALIVRTLNLGLRKSTDPVPKDTCGLDVGKSVEPHPRPSTTGDAKIQSNDVEEEELTGQVPEHSTPSLHKLHTEWHQHHVNIEVLLGLKAPKNSFEALAVQKFREEEASGSANNAFLRTDAVSTQTEKEQACDSIEAKSEMAVDSGVGSRGDCMSSEP